MQHDFLLLDRSQSMSLKGRWAEALASVNTYVGKLATEKVDTGVTLVTFDKVDGDFRFETIRDRITPPTWKPVSDEDALPRGWTPLNDAIARIVNLAKAGHNGTQYEKVAIIIITDGEENSSKEYQGPSGHAAVRKLLDECRAKGWQVLFLGADYDNAQQAAGYGNLAGQTLSADAGMMGATMSATASKRFAYGATGQSMSFTNDEKVKLNQKQ